MASDLEQLLKRAVERFNAIPPEQQREHRRAQRKSWVVGETMLEHPEMTREHAERLYDSMGYWLAIPDPVLKSMLILRQEAIDIGMLELAITYGKSAERIGQEFINGKMAGLREATLRMLRQP